MRRTRHGFFGEIRAWISRQPLVAALRKSRSGKRARFPKARISTRKHHRKQLIRSSAIIFLLICVTLAIVAFSQPRKKVYLPRMADNNTTAVTTENKEANDKQFKAIEHVIRNGSRAELVNLLEGIKYSKAEAIPIWIEKSKHRIAIAERILQVSSNNTEIDSAKASLLDILRESQQILFTNGIKLDRINKQKMANLILNTRNSSSPIARKAAAVGIAFFESVELADLTFGSTEIDKAMRSMQSALTAAGDLDINDLSHAEKLIYIINEIGKKGFNNTQFIEQFERTFAASSDPLVRAVAQKASLELVRRRYNLSGFSEELRENVAAVTKSRSDQIKSLLAKSSEPNPNEDIYWGLLDSFAVLSQSAPQAAQSFSAELTSVFENQQVPEKARQTFSTVQRSMDGLSRPFPVASVRCNSTGSEVAILERDVPTFLFIVEPDSIDKSRKQILEFENSFVEAVRQNKLKFYVLLLDDESQTSDWERLKQITSLTPQCVPVWLTAEASQQFRNKIPFPWSPSWMLIDRNHKLQRVNTSSPLLRAEIVNFISG